MPWVALGCSALLTFLAWNVAQRSTAGRLHDQFVQRTDQLADAISQRVSANEAVLRGGVALFLASDAVTRDEFHAYVHHLDLERHYPGILGVGFARLTREDELPALLARVRQEGFPDFAVMPEGERALYTPIEYIEPFSGRNLRAFGFDMFSDPKRRAAMERALRSGKPTMSSIVRLVQETSNDMQPGFLLYLPIIRGADGSTSQPRVPLGFVYSPLRTRDLVRGTLGRDPTDLDFALYDEGDTRPFYDTRTDPPGPRAELTRERALQLPGRVWRARFWSRPNFEPWISRSEPQVVLGAGLVINVLLFLIVSASASLQRRATALASTMTQELTHAHAREQAQMLASLREKEMLLKEIHHRVKNNLQVVSSLLSLQRAHVTNEEALEPLRQSQRRVLAMAALHEFLYRSRDFARVDTRAYLTHLSSVLADSYPDGEQVALTLDLDDVPLDVDQAIPCGLITNELVSNAFKYAFRGRPRGTLRVALRRRGGELSLMVEDDGPGLPEGRMAKAPTTLGLQLVQLLSQQLGGTLTVRSEAGAHFELRFPYHGEETT